MRKKSRIWKREFKAIKRETDSGSGIPSLPPSLSPPSSNHRALYQVDQRGLREEHHHNEAQSGW
jgi:hypothetical protein